MMDNQTNKFKNIRCVLLLSSFFVLGCAGKMQKQPDTEPAVFGVAVGKTKLDDVKAKHAGKGIFHKGEHGTSVHLVCYTSQKDYFITYESNETGEADRKITAIYVSFLMEPRHSKEHCGEFVEPSQELVISPGLKLGISLEEAEKLEGKPSRRREDLLVYENADSILELNFENNMLSSFRISKVTRD